MDFETVILEDLEVLASDKFIGSSEFEGARPTWLPSVP
jgi:hypothetical protein